MKILIAEDQADVRETLRDILEINGHEVLAAEDGEEALKLAAQAPDFIFCDVPFVFLTARAERPQQREGMALGADDYITKPFRERDILDAIMARTKRHHKVREQIRKLTDQHRREIHAHWSHELLTPLNAVMGSLQVLESDADTISRAELKEMLALIREGAERQEQLAQKLICYFSLEQRLHAPVPDESTCCQAGRAMEAGIARADRRKNPGGEIILSADPGEVSVDEESLAFAIGEVVSNGLNFSAPNSPITIAGVNRGGRYRIEVTDQGPGLTAEQCANIGAFTQFDRKKREQQGLGLGLAIARATATLAGGRIALESIPARCGLRVVFDMPLVTRKG